MKHICLWMVGSINMKKVILDILVYFYCIASSKGIKVKKKAVNIYEQCGYYHIM